MGPGGHQGQNALEQPEAHRGCGQTRACTGLELGSKTMGTYVRILRKSPEHSGAKWECAQSLTPCCKQDWWTPNTGILRSGPKWPRAHMGIRVRRHRRFSWSAALAHHIPLPAQNLMVSTQEPLQRAPKATPLGAPGPGKCLSHTYSASSLPKP